MNVQTLLKAKGFKLSQYGYLILWEYLFPAGDDPKFTNVYSCDYELGNCRLYVDGFVQEVSLEEFLIEVKKLENV